MKFKTVSIKFRTDGRTHDKLKAICHFNFSKVGGIKRFHKRSTALERSVKVFTGERYQPHP